MRHLIYLLAILLLVSAPTLAQPKLEIVGGSAIQFGDFYAGLNTVTHPVTIRNVGKDVLKIDTVVATCGCTAALSSSKRIAPNDSAQVKITFKIGSYRGNVGKTVRILSNDPESPANINFSVNILEVLQPKPEYMYFYNVKTDSAVRKTFELKNVTSEEVTIVKVKSKDPQLSIVRQPKKVLKPGEVTRLVVSLKARQTGYLQGELELTTNFKPSPIVTLGFNAVGK
jgi:hypothetical protein